MQAVIYMQKDLIAATGLSEGHISRRLGELAEKVPAKNVRAPDDRPVGWTEDQFAIVVSLLSQKADVQ